MNQDVDCSDSSVAVVAANVVNTVGAFRTVVTVDKTFVDIDATCVTLVNHITNRACVDIKAESKMRTIAIVSVPFAISVCKCVILAAAWLAALPVEKIAVLVNKC